VSHGWFPHGDELVEAIELPYFLDGERLAVGVAMDQLQPAALAGGQQVEPHGGGGLQIPPMRTLAMITVIAGWIIGWSAIGAWRMVTRDAYGLQARSWIATNRQRRVAIHDNLCSRCSHRKKRLAREPRTSV